MRTSIIALILLSVTQLTFAQSDPFAFPEPGREAKPWTRAWWLGNAVDKPNLTHWLEQLSSAGLGGVEIVPIYGVKGQEHRHIEHLTPEWLDMLAHTTNEADRLDMGVDMPTGTGWPFGGPSVVLEDADIRVSIQKADLKAAGDPVGLPEDGVLLSLMAYGPDGTVRDLTAQVKEGVLSGPMPEGEQRYYLVYYRFSGRYVKRSAPGGAGLTMNPYSAEALAKYLKHFGKAWEGFNGVPLRAFSHDSFEYLGDWTPGLWAAFELQHGYDLRQHLPEMAGEGEPDRVARIKSDYRETLADLLLNGVIRPWDAWSAERGSQTRNQAHGSPGNLIDLYAASDIPETEIFGPTGFAIPGLRNDPDFDNEPPDLLMLKFASSAAHVTGKPLVSSETCTWLGEHFQVSLAQCKPEIDQLLAAGINNMAYHGTPYSPQDAAWPGWLFYASVHFAPTNTWWDDFKYLNEYVAHCQALLQACKPANDVLLYFPLHDIWHDPEGLRKQLTVHNIDDWLIGTPFYDSATWLTENGYAFDYVSDAVLAGAVVEDGHVVTGGNRYKAVVVPETPRMPYGTLEQLFKLADLGATVVFQGALPADVPGYGSLDERRAAMRSLNAIWTSVVRAQQPQGAVRMGAGRIYEGKPLEGVLPASDIRPEALATSGLSMIRLRHNEGWLYFVVNLTGEPVDAFWPLATPARSVVVLDPLSTRTGLAQTEMIDSATAVRIALKPGESCFLRTFAEREVEGDPYPYWAPAGDPVALEGPWKVTFLDGGPEIPEAYTAAQLESWTNAPDEEAKRFGGTARYTITFDAPAATTEAWRLDLGTVCESARVTLNGDFLGCVWSLPYALVVEESLEPKGNILEIEVTNLAANRIADLDRRGVEWKIFEDINLVNIQYKPFDASGWSLFDSGLLGPVQLVPLKLP